jgi:hypothetical protein
VAAAIPEGSLVNMDVTNMSIVIGDTTSYLKVCHALVASTQAMWHQEKECFGDETVTPTVLYPAKEAFAVG